jgi:hypothetical protein
MLAMSPIDMFFGNLRNTQEIELELQQEEYQHYYKQKVTELSRIDEAKQVIELLKSTEGLEYSRDVLAHTRDFVANGRRAMGLELSKRAEERSYHFAVLRREFTPEFHDAIADFITQHPDTLNSLVNKVEYADMNQETFERVLANIEAYTWVMSYLNNFDYNPLIKGEGELEENRDLETFIAHREFGIKESTRLAADIRFLQDKRFVTAAERADILTRWQELEFPIKNINGTVHRKVKRQQGNF